MPRTVFELAETAVLVLAAATAWVTWLRLAPRRGAACWLIAAAGTSYLAVDEGFDLHERLGSWLSARGWHQPAGINHMDDVIAMAMAVVGLVIAWGMVSEFRRHRQVLAPFVASVGFYALSVAWDATASASSAVNWWFEESLELIGGALLTLAYAARFRMARAPELAIRPPTRDARLESVP